MSSDEPTVKSKPWYQKAPVIITLVVAVIAASAAFILLRQRSRAADAHYDELERHRAAQRQQAEQQPAADAQQQPAAPAAEGQPAAAAPAEGQPPAPADAAAAQPAQAPPAGRRNYWTNFRGPARDGRYEERQVRTSWPAEGLQQLWKQPIGGGYSSFSVADGVAYTIEQRRGQEVVAAYRVADGREMWTQGWDALFHPDDTGDGPRSTPTWDDGRLYALGATGEFRALDARTGRVIWSKNILTDNGARNLSWGVAASPLVVDDKVVVMAGGTAGKSVVAYNKMTGARAWASMNDEASYTSPMLVQLAGRRQVLVVTAKSIAGLAPEDGAVIWSHPWANSYSINVSQPLVVSPNRVFVSAGYGKGAALIELASAGGTLTPRAVWENASMKNKFNSSVYHDGHVYGLDEGILTCVDVLTGERKWKGGRYGYGQMLMASGHLIITTEDGDVVLVRATPQAHTEVSRFKALDGRNWNVPAIADGRLLVRNASEMACYKLAD
jgi:outer membrane protein assembly factor BamB